MGHVVEESLIFPDTEIRKRIHFSKSERNNILGNGKGEQVKRERMKARKEIKNRLHDVRANVLCSRF